MYAIVQARAIGSRWARELWEVKVEERALDSADLRGGETWRDRRRVWDWSGYCYVRERSMVSAELLSRYGRWHCESDQTGKCRAGLATCGVCDSRKLK